MRLGRRVGPRVYLKGECIARGAGTQPGLTGARSSHRRGLDPGAVATASQPAAGRPQAGRTATHMDLSWELRRRVGTGEEPGRPTPGRAMATLLTPAPPPLSAFALPVFRSRCKRGLPRRVRRMLPAERYTVCTGCGVGLRLPPQQRALGPKSGPMQRYARAGTRDGTPRAAVCSGGGNQLPQSRVD